MATKKDLEDLDRALQIDREVTKETFRVLGANFDREEPAPATATFECETFEESAKARVMLATIPGVQVWGTGLHVEAGPVSMKPAIDRLALHHRWPIQWKITPS